MDEAYRVGERVELITPAKYLFNAGNTSKQWNEKMLADPDLRIVYYNPDPNFFQNVELKGGVAVSYHEAGANYGAIEVFSAYPELMSIRARIVPRLVEGRLPDSMYLQNKLNLQVIYRDHPEAKQHIGSGGKERRIVTSSFDKLPLFTDSKVGDDDVQILGLKRGNKRAYKWLPKKYIEDNGNLYAFKLVLPMANGSGAFGETLSTPLVIGPGMGYSQSFLGIGSFQTENEAEAALKYIKGKFDSQPV